VSAERIVVGIDEAGYGPRLGPLVVTAALFEAPDSDLEQLLAPAAVREAANDDARVVVNDSKKVYRNRTRLAALEKTSLVFASAASGRIPRNLGELLGDVDARTFEWSRCPWYGTAPLELPLPLALSSQRRERLLESRALLAITMERRNVRFLGFRCAVLSAPRFNREILRLGNKSNLLAHQVLNLITGVLDFPSRRSVQILVDKLGGRNHYAPLLAERFSLANLITREEGRPRSSYTLRRGGRDVHVDFVRSGDSLHFPVALASVFSKYIREIFVFLINAFWTALDPTLKPTAGYPQDAGRFLDAIRDRAVSEGIDLEEFQRQR